MQLQHGVGHDGEHGGRGREVRSLASREARREARGGMRVGVEHRRRRAGELGGDVVAQEGAVRPGGQQAAARHGKRGRGTFGLWGHMHPIWKKN